jgi:hypothetical protein
MRRRPILVTLAARFTKAREGASVARRREPSQAPTRKATLASSDNRRDIEGQERRDVGGDWFEYQQRPVRVLNAWACEARLVETLTARGGSSGVFESVVR